MRLFIAKTVKRKQSTLSKYDKTVARWGFEQLLEDWLGNVYDKCSVDPNFVKLVFSLAMHSGCCTKHVLHHNGELIYNKMANQLRIGPVSSIISVIWNQYVTWMKYMNVAHQQWLKALRLVQKNIVLWCNHRYYL